MAVFVWKPQFVLNVTVIDEQHKVLVRLINDMGQILAGKMVAQYSVIFSDLIKYTRYHFITEEALMLASGYPLNNVNAHIKQHKQFIDELGSVCADNSIVSEDELSVILSFLTNWLSNHICKVDKKLAAHIQAEESVFSAWEEKQKLRYSAHTHQKGDTQSIEIDYKCLMGYFHEMIRQAEDDIKKALFTGEKEELTNNEKTIEQALKKIAMVRKAVGRLTLSH